MMSTFVPMESCLLRAASERASFLGCFTFNLFMSCCHGNAVTMACLAAWSKKSWTQGWWWRRQWRSTKVIRFDLHSFIYLYSINILLFLFIYTLTIPYLMSFILGSAKDPPLETVGFKTNCQCHLWLHVR